MQRHNAERASPEQPPAPEAGGGSVDEQRWRLAELLGRLLARRWLRERRASPDNPRPHS